MKYLIKIKNSEYILPKENLILFAKVKAIDLDKYFNINTNEEAIKFFKSIDVEVSEVENEHN